MSPNVSENTLGYDDLDTRPPEPLRSLLQYGVQRCPSCGYSSNDISKGHDRTAELVKSTHYQGRLNDNDVPELATSFYNCSVDKAEQHQYRCAAWNLIYAAWVCDDEEVSGYTDTGTWAQWFREKARSSLITASRNSQSLSKSDIVDCAIIIDLLRRLGEFEWALSTVKDLREMFHNKAASHVFNFQSTLILQEDAECHNLSEIPQLEGCYSIPTGSLGYKAKVSPGVVSDIEAAFLL